MKTGKLPIHLLATSLLIAQCTFGQTNAFTYQGELAANGLPANGIFDFQFTVYDSPVSGSVVGSAVPVNDLSVTNGLFTAALNFGSNVFNGQNRWLAIAVRPGTNTGAYTTLNPRQLFTPTPYALYSPIAGSLPAGAVNATMLQSNAVGTPNLQNGAVTTGKIGAGQVVKSINSLRDDVTLVAGTNVAISTVGSSIQISATGLGPGSGWNLNGNSGTTTDNFLGTTDNRPMEIRVKNHRSLKIEPAEYLYFSDPFSPPLTNLVPNIIAGYAENSADSGVAGATVGGGGFIYATNRVTGDFGTIGGGAGNTVSGSATIAGGRENAANDTYSVVGGGWKNVADGYASTISGGLGNSAGGNGTVCGGAGNVASGILATVAGGADNVASGRYSFAAGNFAHAVHRGAFVWGGAETETNFASYAILSTRENEFTARCLGGARFITAVSGVNPVAGVRLAPGGGSWSSLSDRNAKTNFATVNARDILARLASVPVQTWTYRSQEKEMTRHIGPMAQDFAAAFNVGEDNRHISTVDADGVALAAIQGLNEIVQQQKSEIQAKDKRIESLERRLANVEDLLTFLTDKK